MSHFRTSQPGEDAEPRLPRGSEAVQTLRKQLQSVERESITLQRIASGLDEFVHQQEGRLNELESELNDTALLYVAGEQFHAVLDPKYVLGYIRELLEQLLGAEVFVVYLRTGEATFQPIVWRGIPEEKLRNGQVPFAPLEASIASGRPIVVEGRPLPSGTLDTPVAAVPLLVQDRVIGAAIIAKLFAHKEGWAPADAQLMQLLSTRTGSTLLGAYLIRSQSDLLGTLAGLGESLK